MENPLYMAIFNSYDCMFIRGFYLNRSFSMVESPSSRDPLLPPLGTLCSKEGFDVAEVRVASRQIHQSHFLQPSARARARGTWRFCQVVLISRTSTDSVFKVSFLRKLPKCPFLNVRNGRKPWCFYRCQTLPITCMESPLKIRCTEIHIFGRTHIRSASFLNSFSTPNLGFKSLPFFVGPFESPQPCS